MSYLSIAATRDSHAPWLMNLGAHLHANPIICKTAEYSKWITAIQMCITVEFDSSQTAALGLLVICLFYDFWQMA